MSFSRKSPRERQAGSYPPMVLIVATSRPEHDGRTRWPPTERFVERDPRSNRLVRWSMGMIAALILEGDVVLSEAIGRTREKSLWRRMF